MPQAGFEPAQNLSSGLVEWSCAVVITLGVQAVLKTEFKSENHIEAINTLAIPVVKYIFNIINWTIPEIRRLDMKACNRMHHLKVDANRIYIPRNEGRRGMIWLN